MFAKLNIKQMGKKAWTYFSFWFLNLWQDCTERLDDFQKLNCEKRRNITFSADLKTNSSYQSAAAPLWPGEPRCYVISNSSCLNSCQATCKLINSIPKWQILMSCVQIMVFTTHFVWDRFLLSSISVLISSEEITETDFTSTWFHAQNTINALQMSSLEPFKSEVTIK